MTKRPQELGRADATEVTPAMLDAGVAVYLEHCPDSGVGDELDRRMVGRVFRAMAEAGSLVDSKP